MPLDPSILAQTKPFQAPDPLQNYAKILQIQSAQQQLQNAGIQQQVSQMQLEEMKRDREEMAKFQQELVAKGGNPDLRQYAQVLLQSPKHFQTGVELLQKLEQQDQLSKIMGGGMAQPVNALALSAAAPETPANVLAAQTPVTAPQAPANALRGKLALPTPGGMGTIPPGSPVGAPAMPSAQAVLGMAAPVSDQAQETLKKINQLYALGTPQAINIAKGLEAQMKFLESRTMSPQQQAAEARAQRQLQLAEQTANPEFQQQMAAAKQAGALAAKSSVEAQKTLPGAISKAEESLRLIDELVGKPGGKPHPGFETAVGMGLPLRFIPGTNAADFQARFDQVKGASFLAAFESLKGGGSITEKEGQKATSAINRMSLAQSEQEFVTAARDLQNILKNGIKDAKKRLQNAAPSASAPSLSSPAAGGAKFLGFE